MQRNRPFSYPKQSSPVMSRSLIYTAGVGVNPLLLDDEEDNDICPVCDGDCTCNNRPRFPALSVSSGGAQYVATPNASTSSFGDAPGVQSLKIKLTVPPGMQNKVRSLGSAPKKSRADGSSSKSNGAAGSGSVVSFTAHGQSHHARASSTAGHGHHSVSEAAASKRRGRPKAPVALRDKSTIVPSGRLIRGNEATTLPQSQSHLQSHPPHAQRSIGSKAPRPIVKSSGQPKSNITTSRQTQAKATIVKKAASKNKKKQSFLCDDTDSDLDGQSVDTFQDDDDDDDDGHASCGHFPTFVSADGLTSEASDSSDCDLDSETSGFGSDSSLAAEEESYILAEQRRHDKARVRRELLGEEAPKHKDSHNNWVIRPRKKSVGLSDVDMDGDSDDITEDEEEEEEEEEEVEDGEEEDEADGQPSRVYTGLATGWSDDEESSFDADLFFDNLSDTTFDSSASDADDSPQQDAEADGDVMADSISSLRSMDFEVTEAWDGQIVFTNGSHDGQGVLDLAFEANAAQLLASDSASINHDSDVEMGTSDGGGDDYGEGGSELDETDGNTTEEELVDKRGLPTSRAMRLFRWPTSVSAINPMSTVSPNISPAPFNRHTSVPTSQQALESPRPADILAGKVFWEEKEHVQSDSAEGSVVGSPRAISRSGVAVMGQFNLGGSAPQKTAVLTGVNKDVPSPYPRLGRRRRRFSSSGGSFSSMDLRGRTAKLSIYTPSSLPPPSDEPSSDVTPAISLGEPIQLDDVLDPTFLDSEPDTQTQTASEGEHRHVQSLNRWDRVPVGAFRLTRESAAPTSDIPTSPAWIPEPAKSTVPDVLSYGNVLKSSPLHTMLWHDKNAVKETPRKSKAVMDVIISPVLLPVQDGDHTPTDVPHNHDHHSNHHQKQRTPHKNRKESRREMKMSKRKTHGPIHPQHHHHHQHRHNHHPNMKARGSAAVQRTNFFSSPTSVPPLNI
ncbi:hypothetical protein PAXRUDRAFT_825900 [Paxillus rubicundulus Ve08.2h10]|uniref:Uncharacterized protein n=1 Tax=Paxillus rubicundulus Ve08.2h10 TaxID=930991 RepID=A0A0D0DFL5_9AGAM|nr:hypothetical protein PAXRUDRAFT_825900 [Paxillus rubicundulus Ve08.2h10]